MRTCRGYDVVSAPVSALLIALGAALAAAAPGRADHPELKRLHALLVIDTKSGLGESVEVDGERMKRLLTEGLPKDKVSLTVLKGDDVTSAKILAYYKNLNTGPSEAVLFFYAGHGAIDPKKGHFLALQELNAEPLLRNQLKRAMRQKNPGLAVLLTDCCSSRFRLPQKHYRASDLPSGDALRCLLLRHRGVVDVTAAAPDTAAFGDDSHGGLFTFSLGKLLSKQFAELDTDGDRFVSWREFFPQLRQGTEKQFTVYAKQHRAQGEKIDQKTQSPEPFALAGDVTLENKTRKEVRYQSRWAGDGDWESVSLAPGSVKVHAMPEGRRGRNPDALEVKLEGKTFRLVPGDKQVITERK
jgi:hypothetical protein